MARPLKTGLDYFSLDTEFDDEMEAFIDTFGNDGGMFFVRVWQRAYRTDDGEVSYSGVFRRTALAKRVNVSVELLDQMVQAACELGLLDAEALASRQVLTSNGIKKRIGRVLAERESARGRKKNGAPEFSGAKTPEPPPVIRRTSAERKGKESKGKEIVDPSSTESGGGQEWKEFAPRLKSTEAFMQTLIREFTKPIVEHYLAIVSDHLANAPPVEDGGAYLRKWMRTDRTEKRGMFKPASGTGNRPPETDMSKHASRRPAEDVLREQRAPSKSKKPEPVGKVLANLKLGATGK